MKERKVETGNNVKKDDHNTNNIPIYNPTNFQYNSMYPFASNYTNSPFYLNQMLYNPYPYQYQYPCYNTNPGYYYPQPVYLPFNPLNKMNSTTSQTNSHVLDTKHKKGSIGEENDCDSNNSKSSNKESCNNDNKKTFSTIKEIFTNKKNLIKYLNTYKGSKRVQLLIDNTKEADDIELIVAKIFPFLRQFSQHKYGNYFIQNLIKQLTIQQRTQFWNLFFDKNITDYTNSQFSSHVLIRLIECTSDSYEWEFILSNLKDNFVNMVYHHYGVVVLQSIIKALDKDSIKVFKFFIQNNFLDLCNNKNSLLLLKDFIMKLSEKENAASDIKQILLLIKINFDKLIYDKLGVNLIVFITNTIKYQLWYNILSDFLNEDIVSYATNRFSSRLILSIITNKEISYYLKNQFVIKSLFNFSIFKQLSTNEFAKVLIKEGINYISSEERNKLKDSNTDYDYIFNDSRVE